MQKGANDALNLQLMTMEGMSEECREKLVSVFFLLFIVIIFFVVGYFSGGF